MEMGKWEIESTPIPSPRRWQYNLTGHHHHHPPTTQLLTLKEDSYNKVPLVKMSQDDPLNPSNKKNYQVDSENNNQGESNMIKEKIINNSYYLGEWVRVAKWK